MKENTVQRTNTIETRLPGPALDDSEGVVPYRPEHLEADHIEIIDLRTGPKPSRPRPNEPLDAYIERRVSQVLAARHPRRRPMYEAAKRALDVVVSGTLLVITSPIIALLSIIIRLDSDGPAIFRSRRVGQGGRIIDFCKFRTMYIDAKERFPELYDYTFTEEEFATAYYKPSFDPRHTPFGRRLHKRTLDELPNLINVLKGEVSLVGPRPELPELIPYYTDEQLMKFSVKSGVTGVAQTSGRGNLTIQEQIEADLEYVRRRSFLYDLRLLGRTLGMLVERVRAK